MALWDHVRTGERNPARPRRAAAHFTWRDGPAFLRKNFGPPRSSNDNARCVLDEGPADELDCLRRVLAPELLRAAEARAKELGIGADRVLILWGVIDEEAYLQRLAFHTGLSFYRHAGSPERQGHARNQSPKSSCQTLWCWLRDSCRPCPRHRAGRACSYRIQDFS